jgi:hypothetical protein
MQTAAPRGGNLTPRSGTADANERRGADDQAFRADLATTDIAYFVYTGIDFRQRRVNRREVLARLGGERRYVLPLESNGRAFRVVLVVAACRALVRTGDDGGELPLKLREPVTRLVAIGRQAHLRGTLVSHFGGLSFKVTIPSAGETKCAGSSGIVKVMTRSAAKSFPVTVTQLPVTRCEICQRTVAYRPGEASEALTKHYKLQHKDALGEKPAEPGED